MAKGENTRSRSRRTVLPPAAAIQLGTVIAEEQRTGGDRRIATMIEAIFERGCTIRVDASGQLLVGKSSLLPENVREDIRANKPALIEAVREMQRVYLVNCPWFVTTTDGSELSACLACGGSWELHGRPPRDRWHSRTTSTR